MPATRSKHSVVRGSRDIGASSLAAKVIDREHASPLYQFGHSAPEKKHSAMARVRCRIDAPSSRTQLSARTAMYRCLLLRGVNHERHAFGGRSEPTRA